MKTIIHRLTLTLFLIASFALNGMNNANNQNNDHEKVNTRLQAYIDAEVQAEAFLKTILLIEIEVTGYLAWSKAQLQVLKSDNSPIAAEYQELVSLIEEDSKMILGLIKKLDHPESGEKCLKILLDMIQVDFSVLRDTYDDALKLFSESAKASTPFKNQVDDDNDTVIVPSSSSSSSSHNNNNNSMTSTTTAPTSTGFRPMLGYNTK